MKYEEAIERIENLKVKAEVSLHNIGESYEWLKEDVKGTITAFSMAIEAIEKQATKQATSNYISEWIPVSERLPDKNGTYLITVSSYDETASIEYIAVDHCNSDGGFLHFETKKNPKAKSGKVVTAWMPCPEPYKENK